MEKQVRFFNLFGIVVRDDIGGDGPVATYSEIAGERTLVEVNTLEPVPVRELDKDWKQWVQGATTHGWDAPGKEEKAA